MTDIDKLNKLDAVDTNILLESMRAGARLLDADYPSVSLVLDRAADIIAAQSKRIEELENEREWVRETLVEINPSNYDHADVCEMNSKSVEVILALSSDGGSDNG